MNSNTPFTKDKNKLILSKKNNVPFIKIPKIFNPFTISNSQRGAKDISYENNCRAPYMNNEVDLPSILFNFVYTKIQQKSIEKKIKKGLLNSNELKTPLTAFV